MRISVLSTLNFNRLSVAVNNSPALGRNVCANILSEELK
jgi:hypothetical protein